MVQADWGRAMGGWPAGPTSDWVGLLASVGIIAAGFSGCSGITVADFLYI